MPRLAVLAGAAALLLAGCRSAGTVSPGAVSVPTPDVIPAGTQLGLRLEQGLGLGASEAGDPFRATVASLVVTEGGDLVVPVGTDVFGTVTGLAAPAGGRPGTIRLAFDRIVLGGRTHPLAAAVLQTDVEAEGDGTARGRILGGAPGPGTVISLGTDAEAAALPVGTLLLVATERPILLP